jgi:hypothetical protein
MSIAPKMDEIRPFVVDSGVNIAAFTETWLKDSVLDSVVAIPGFNISRKDRDGKIHGGVCIYINNNIKFSTLNYLHNQSFEVLWTKLLPKRLPRGISSIIVGTIYHPPASCNQSMIEYLIDALTNIEANNSNCGIILMGDLNRLETSRINRQFKLKQLVKFDTRGEI